MIVYVFTCLYVKSLSNKNMFKLIIAENIYNHLASVICNLFKQPLKRYFSGYKYKNLPFGAKILFF